MKYPLFLAEAIKSDSAGTICGFCSGENDFADDVGFWYLVPLNYSSLSEEEKSKIKTLPCCEKCFYGEPGENHKNIFGVGDR